MTHDERVLGLLSDGEPHSSGEVYDLRVVAHSRVASLRRKGHRIECWRENDTYFYRLVLNEDDGGLAPPPEVLPSPVVLVEPDTGQLALDVAA